MHGQAENFARFERLVPPGFDRYFYYQVGVRVMTRHPIQLPKAVAAVEFVRHRSAAAHHLALVGIYRSWPLGAAWDRTPELLVPSPIAVASELQPHYSRALGFSSVRYWFDT